MKVLFIGGTGVISTPCSKLCIERGMDLWLLNRGNHPERMPADVGFIPVDINDHRASKMLADSKWDCVVDWTVLTGKNVLRAFGLFFGRTKQYIYINSTCVYKAPPLGHAIVETDPLVDNPIWAYTRGKLEAERHLGLSSLPVTVVRAGHTYGDFTIPTNIIGLGYGLVERMKQGKKVIVHDDGQSLWTLSHNSDVAVGIVGLIGREDAIGETFHITSSEAITWLDIFRTYTEALGVKLNPEFIPSTRILQVDYEIGTSLLGHRALSKAFDNSKVKSLVPEYSPKVSFAEGIRRSLKWHERHKDKIYYKKSADDTVELILKRWRNGDN